MIKKILIGFGAVVVVAVLVPAALVLLNMNPFGLVERLPLVYSFTVEGDVRMTDGASLPEDTVTVRVTKEGGRSTKAKATEKSGYAYRATFVAFKPPIGGDDKIAVTATMSAPASLLSQTDALEGEDLLLADYPARPAFASMSPEADRIILADRKLRVGSGEAPKDVEGWSALLLAGLRNLPHLQIDDDFTVVMRAQQSERIAGDPPFQLTFPNTLTAAEARALRLSDIGEEIGREDFVWDKKSPTVGFNYEMTRRSFRSVHVRDEDGLTIRSERLGKPGQTGTQTWVWDGRDNDGALAPAPPTGKPYTFIANADSFDLDPDPSISKGFQIEILASSGPRVRYGEFNSATTVAEFLDTFGLSLMRNVRGGQEYLELRQSTLLHTARLAGDPEDTEAAIQGDSTVGDLLTAFGVTLDTMERATTQVAEFDMVLRGATIRARLDFMQFRSAVSVATREEFLDLPLTSIEAKQSQGFVALAGEFAANGPVTITVTRRLGEENLEDFERGRSEEFEFTLNSSDTLRLYLENVNKLDYVSATIQGSVHDEFEYDVLLGVPNGQSVTFFLAPEDTPNELRVNVRASGVMAKLTGDPVTVPGDASTPMGVEAIVVGLDGSESTDDVVTASVTEGMVIDRGAMRYVDAAYRGQYTAIETEEDATDALVVTATALQERNATRRAEDKDRGGVLYMAVVSIDVLGVEPAPVVALPTPDNGGGPEAANGSGAGGPVAGADGATVPAAGAAPDTRKMAKLYGSLPPASAAELMLAMPADEARPILLGMGDREASKIIDAIITGDVGETAASLGAAERVQSLLAILGASNKHLLTTSP